MYKVVVEESSGERTSSNLISHASPPTKKAIRQFFLQISCILRRCEAPCTRLLSRFFLELATLQQKMLQAWAQRDCIA